MEVLKRAYGRIFNLQEYIYATLQDAPEKLSKYSQKPGFQIILRKTLVAVSPNNTLRKRAPSSFPSDDEGQMEVVEEVIQEMIIRGNKTNVLALGVMKIKKYSDGVPFHPDHNYTQLITPFWSKILYVIGKDAMKDLLHNTSIFIEAGSGCYIQLSGDPVHTSISKSHMPAALAKKKSTPAFTASSTYVVETTDTINTADTISAVSLCYDKNWYQKGLYPLNSFPASISGADQLVRKIFQKQNGGTISKAKKKRIPDRLRRSRDVLRQLLCNIKGTRLEVFQKTSSTQRKKRNQSGHTCSVILTEDVNEFCKTDKKSTQRKKTVTRENQNSHGNDAQQGMRKITHSFQETNLDEEQTAVKINGTACENSHGTVREINRQALNQGMTDSDEGDIEKMVGLNVSNSGRQDSSMEIFSSPEMSNNDNNNDDTPDVTETRGTKEKRKEEISPVTMETIYFTAGDRDERSEEPPSATECPKSSIIMTTKRSSAQTVRDQFHSQRNSLPTRSQSDQPVIICGQKRSIYVVDNLTDIRRRKKLKTNSFDRTSDQSRTSDLLSGITGVAVDPEDITSDQSRIGDLLSSGDGVAVDPEDITSDQSGISDLLYSGDGVAVDPEDITSDQSRIGDLLSSGNGVAVDPEDITSDQSRIGDLLSSGTGVAVDPEDITSDQSRTSDLLYSGTGVAVDPEDITSDQSRNSDLLSSGTGVAVDPEDITSDQSRNSDLLSSGTGVAVDPEDITSDQSRNSDLLSSGNGVAVDPEDILKDESVLKRKTCGSEKDGMNIHRRTIATPRDCLNSQGHVTMGAKEFLNEDRVIGNEIKKYKAPMNCRNRSLIQIITEDLKRLRQKLKKKKKKMQAKQILMAKRKLSKYRRRRMLRIQNRKEKESDNVSSSSVLTKNLSTLGDGSVNAEADEMMVQERRQRRGLDTKHSRQTSVNMKTSHTHGGLDTKHSRQTSINMETSHTHDHHDDDGNIVYIKIHGKKYKKVCGHGSTSNHTVDDKKQEKTIHKESQKASREESPLSSGMTGTEVYVSLRGLLKKIIPMEIWGSTTNQNAFFKYVKLMVKLGRFEKLPLDLLKKSLRISDCLWTKSNKEDWKNIPRTDWMKRKELAETMFDWLITDLVLPLIRLQYYVTETSVSKNELAYFPKAKWKTMEETALTDYKKLGVLSEIDQLTLRMMVDLQKTLGKSKLRFIPKEKGFRPIVRLGKSSLPGKEKYDINFLLRDALDIFNYLWRDYPKLFGFSRLGVTSIYPKWREFVVKRKQNGDSRPLYFVKMDISKCYDSIPQDKLFRVITTNLKQKELPNTYVIRRYWVTTITRHGDVRKTVMRYVSPADGIRYDTRSCHQILVDLAKNGRHHNSIITNQVSVRVEGVDSILKKLQQLIHNDIVSVSDPAISGL
ncbi:uncharacterized protein [Apostichopus japonicus]|uniref:uncharacterized protein isoform X2 n=1 Tax=Stichopus japonicus TaxID=307972 RepID=UPI003AB22A9E